MRIRLAQFPPALSGADLFWSFYFHQLFELLFDSAREGRYLLTLRLSISGSVEGDRLAAAAACLQILRACNLFSHIQRQDRSGQAWPNPVRVAAAHHAVVNLGVM